MRGCFSATLFSKLDVLACFANTVLPGYSSFILLTLWIPVSFSAFLITFLPFPFLLLSPIYLPHSTQDIIENRSVVTGTQPTV